MVEHSPKILASEEKATSTSVGKRLHTLPSHLTMGEYWGFELRNAHKDTNITQRRVDG